MSTNKSSISSCWFRCSTIICKSCSIICFRCRTSCNINRTSINCYFFRSSSICCIVSSSCYRCSNCYFSCFTWSNNSTTINSCSTSTISNSPCYSSIFSITRNRSCYSRTIGYIITINCSRSTCFVNSYFSNIGISFIMDWAFSLSLFPL